MYVYFPHGWYYHICIFSLNKFQANISIHIEIISHVFVKAAQIQADNFLVFTYAVPMQNIC